MPFADPERLRYYHAEYQEALRQGGRKVEPSTLKEALQELREARKLLQKQRKRIWFLENKETLAEAQRRRRREAASQNAQAALAGLEKALKSNS